MKKGDGSKKLSFIELHVDGGNYKIQITAHAKAENLFEEFIFKGEDIFFKHSSIINIKLLIGMGKSMSVSFNVRNSKK